MKKSKSSNYDGKIRIKTKIDHRKERKVKKIKVKVDESEVKGSLKKVKKLRRLLKEANSLADELASKDINITVKM